MCSRWASRYLGVLLTVESKESLVARIASESIKAPSRLGVRFQGSNRASSMEALSIGSSVADIGGHRNPWRPRSGTITFPALLISK